MQKKANSSPLIVWGPRKCSRKDKSGLVTSTSEMCCQVPGAQKVKR